MTIYVVTSGAYSDYHIDAVFTDKAKAEQFCAEGEDDGYANRGIEEWEPDPTGWVRPEGLWLYRVMMHPKGVVGSVERYAIPADGPEQFQKREYFWTGSDLPAHHEWVTSVWARDKDHAIKVAAERRAQHMIAGTWKLPS